MQKFICEQNIAHFQKLQAETTDVSFRRMLESLLLSAKRELAVLNSTRTGVDASPLDEHRRRVVDTRSIRLQIQSEFERSCHPYMLLDPGPGLKIIDINAAYAAATFISCIHVVGRSLFEVLPDNPTDALADGVSNLYASLKIVQRPTDRTLWRSSATIYAIPTAGLSNATGNPSTARYTIAMASWFSCCIT